MRRIVLGLVVVGQACCPAPGDEATTGERYSADVRWTSWGIPHVIAGDYGSLGFGLGYAFARDHFCVLADQVVMVHGERAKWFGAGDDDININTDFGWKAIGVVDEAEARYTELPEDLQANLEGYAAGVDRWLDETGVNGLPEACRGADWVRPIDEYDLLAYYLALGEIASGEVWVDAVGSARPPGGAKGPPPPDLGSLVRFARSPFGSNGWALGRERTESGRGMLLSNTHFPAEGKRQWHESHLTIPGVLDAYGASLLAVPIINVGFNEHVAWTHTVSNTPRFVMYELPLDPDDPTRYLYDGQYLDMTPADYSVEVLGDNGTVSTLTRTLYSSRYGPVINAPVIGWTTATAFSYRDANPGNLAMPAVWAAMNRADDLASFQAAHAEIGGIPWVHTMMTDDQGDAWYIDSASTPNLTEPAEAAYEDFVAVDYLAKTFADYGVMLVDGSDPIYEWADDPDARAPGLVGYARQPQLLRDDFVFNANDNYWLTNPDEPLEGYAAIYGSVRSPRTPRTRMNARLLTDDSSGDDGLFSMDELQQAALGGRGIIEELLRDDVVAACTAQPEVTVSFDGVSQVVDLTDACAALGDWDGRVGTDRRGAALWRELLGSESYGWADLIDAGSLFADPFDPDDPVETPATLADADTALQSLGIAVLRLEQAGIDLDAPLGDVQFLRKGTVDVPVLGGQSIEGTIAIATFSEGASGTLLPPVQRGTVLDDTTDLTDEGYVVNYGNSFVLTVEFTDDGPLAEAVMTYSESEDPDSEHYVDQSWLYGQGELRPCLFREDDIAADPNLEEHHLTGP